MSGIATVAIGEKQWSVEVATTSAELAQGLSNRAPIPEFTGMLFDLRTERIVTVNAYEMLFPFSVVFIGEDLKVTEVAYLLAPGDDSTTSLPCRYFLETNVGEVDDIQAGDLVAITGYTPSAGINISSMMNLMVTMMIVTMMMKMMAKMMKEVK